MRLVPRLLLALALATSSSLSLSGCGPKGMRKIEVPGAGVRLAYDLSPGASYSGHLRIGNTQSFDGASISQALECDVKLVVVGDDPRGALVRATFSNVDLKWGLPPSTPVSPEEFAADATAKLQGMNVTFNVKPTGEITYMPAPPQDVPDELKSFIDQVLRALEEGFLVVPDRALKDGESWDEDEQRGRKGKLGRYVEGKVTTKVAGMFHDEGRKEDLLRLEIQHKRKEVFTTKDGARTTESDTKATALFSTAGYLADVEGESRDYDPVNGMAFRKVDVKWKKLQGGDANATGGGGGDVQAITDPCDPDYVGEAECQGGGEVQAIT
ncbi:MAG: hypothetical protein K1X88_33575, partial [Nannocystaceae bacterium]|nr:hypothetical protein [Nannocystaceae bacterium]